MSKPLREFADVHYGKSPKDVLHEDGSVPIVGTGGIYGRSEQALFQGPAVVVPRKGSLGNPQYMATPFWPVDTTYAVLPKPGVDARWLYYNLYRFDLTKLNEATGVPSISRDWLYKVPFADVDYANQQEIVKILSTVDEAIEQTEALIAKTQQIKAGLMHDLFTRGVKKDGKLRPPRDEASYLYKESPLGWIPKEWGVTCICNIARVVDSLHRTPSFVDEGYPMVRVTDINDDELNLESCIRVTDETFKEFTVNHMPGPGDIVLSRVGTYGIPSFVATKSPFCIGQNTVIITNISNSRFVYYFLKTEIVKRQFERATVGSSQSTLSLAAIRSCLLSLPNLSEQDWIVQKLNSVFNLLSCALDELQKYSVLKQGLMHDLLTGRVRVKTDSVPPTEAAHV